MIDIDAFLTGKTFDVCDEDDVYTQIVSYSDAYELWQNCTKENENLEKEVKRLREELATAVRYLWEAKWKFVPDTTNSLVDDFIAKHTPKREGEG